MYLDSKIYGYYFKGYISGMLLIRLASPRRRASCSG
jgi:hypothetical protein